MASVGISDLAAATAAAAAATAGAGAATFVSIPTSEGQYSVQLEITDKQPLDLFRAFDKKITLEGDCNLTRSNNNYIAMQGQIEANSGSKINLFYDVDGTPSQITFAQEVDLSKATSVTFSDCKTVFKKKLTI